MDYLFYNCESLSFLPDISNWDTKCVRDMNNVFCNSKSLTSLPDILKLLTNSKIWIVYFIIMNHCHPFYIFPNVLQIIMVIK